MENYAIRTVNFLFTQKIKLLKKFVKYSHRQVLFPLYVTDKSNKQGCHRAFDDQVQFSFSSFPFFFSRYLLLSSLLNFATHKKLSKMPPLTHSLHTTFSVNDSIQSCNSGKDNYNDSVNGSRKHPGLG